MIETSDSLISATDWKRKLFQYYLCNNFDFMGFRS